MLAPQELLLTSEFHVNLGDLAHTEDRHADAPRLHAVLQTIGHGSTDLVCVVFRELIFFVGVRIGWS